MPGWFNAASAFASRSKRATRSWSSKNSSGSSLIATLRSSLASRALQTSPMPPAPSGAINSYGPRRLPGVMQTFRPVDHDPHGRRGVGNTLDRREEAAIGRHVECPPPFCRQGEERGGIAGLERRRPSDRDCEELAVRRRKEDLASVPAPPQQRRPGRRDARFFRAALERLHVRLWPARLVGDVSDELRVGRQVPPLLLVSRGDDGRGLLLGRERERKEAPAP